MYMMCMLPHVFEKGPVECMMTQYNLKTSLHSSAEDVRQQRTDVCSFLVQVTLSSDH